MKCGVIKKSISTIYECASDEMESKGQVVSAISDEGLCGMLLEVTGEEKQGYLPIKTFYGYEGYIPAEDLCLISQEEGLEWESSNLWVVGGACVDVVSLPRVQGLRLISLFRGSLLQVLMWDSQEEGWAKVRLADGREGYIRNQYLWEKKFSQKGALGIADGTVVDIADGTVVDIAVDREIPQKSISDEQQFRRDVVETAKTYLGVQYRWGGRSTAGIDCSGLTSASYMLNGILTYRDAKIVDGYPVHEIRREDMAPGDLLYFPGHIAMYIGDGMYIHSTGRIGSGGVVYNSLDPESQLYRQDLAESLYAVGSIF